MKNIFLLLIFVITQVFVITQARAATQAEVARCTAVDQTVEESVSLFVPIADLEKLQKTPPKDGETKNFKKSFVVSTVNSGNEAARVGLDATVSMTFSDEGREPLPTVIKSNYSLTINGFKALDRSLNFDVKNKKATLTAKRSNGDKQELPMNCSFVKMGD